MAILAGPVLGPHVVRQKTMKNRLKLRLFKVWNDVIERVVELYPGTKEPVQLAFRPANLNLHVSKNSMSTRSTCVVELKPTATASSPTSPENPRWFWENATTVVEFEKTNDEDIPDAAAKIRYHCTQFLRNDPCRRFIFGITIENTEMRLWHFSCSGIVTTQPINWIEHSTAVIHVFTSLVFASPTNLGYDLQSNESWSKTLSSMKSPCRWQYLRHGWNPFVRCPTDVTEGRATRVWNVYKKDGNREDCFVLKELWMYSHSKSEGDMLHDLLEKIDAKDHHYFLTVVLDGSVHLDGDLVDQTFETIMRGIPPIIKNQSIKPSHTYNEEPKLHVDGRQRIHPSGVKEVYSMNLDERDIIPRTHYIGSCFEKYVCHSTTFEIWGWSSLYWPRQPKVSRTKSSPVFAVELHPVLRILHNNRTVHGDLSTGNILSYNGEMKLTDLEYSRAIDQETKAGFRTGTRGPRRWKFHVCDHRTYWRHILIVHVL